MTQPTPTPSAHEVARRLARELEARGIEYALGGAIALGYWGVPRGTLDVDVTLFVPKEKPSECLWLLGEIGCRFLASSAMASLVENGFCSVTFGDRRIDVFVPTNEFYEAARRRKREVRLGGQSTFVWDAESLTVFKLMFFRRKDLADAEQMLRTQGKSFDRAWVREQIVAMYGARDPRVAQWDELCQEVAED
jgi:hypothetical protein